MAPTEDVTAGADAAGTDNAGTVDDTDEDVSGVADVVENAEVVVENTGVVIVESTGIVLLMAA